MLTSEREKEIRSKIKFANSFDLNRTPVLIEEIDKLISENNKLNQKLKEKLAVAVETLSDAIGTIHNEFCSDEHHILCIEYSEALSKIRGEG